MYLSCIVIKYEGIIYFIAYSQYKTIHSKILKYSEEKMDDIKGFIIYNRSHYKLIFIF